MAMIEVMSVIDDKERLGLDTRNPPFAHNFTRVKVLSTGKVYSYDVHGHAAGWVEVEPVFSEMD